MRTLLLALALLAAPCVAAAQSVTISGNGHTADAAAADLAKLSSVTQKFNGDHGKPATYAGPLLWQVLTQAGVIDSNFHKRVAHAIAVTGSDGYVAVLALGEINPEFENKPVILATTRDGTPEAPRVIIPGDKRAGRSVRDVVRIEVK